MERKRASNVYRWLWWSPLLTVPTFLILSVNDPGYVLVCGDSYMYCDWRTAERVNGLIGVLGSALWHLVLLIPARNKENAFVRWHGRQALQLALIRTAIPLGLILLISDKDIGFTVSVPFLLIFWFSRTRWGQKQAEMGDCSLARSFGYEDDLPGPEEAKEDVESLIEIIRFSHDEEARGNALMKLKELGLVEDL
jgi:hypothetical protein